MLKTKEGNGHDEHAQSLVAMSCQAQEEFQELCDEMVLNTDVGAKKIGKKKREQTR